MRSFPMFLVTTGRRIVVVGGGESAAQKARLAARTDAAAGRAAHHSGPLAPALFQGAALVFVATGCAGADAAAHALAKAAGAVVNVVDRPEMCDATTPSIVDRDPVVVAIGTEGTAPVLARRIRAEVEALLPPRTGAYAALAGRLRGAVAQRVPQAARRAFWAWAFAGAPWRAHAAGDEAGAAAMLEDAVAAGRVPEGAGAGHIALVGAGPGARDLLTLRAVQRLQEADVVFYDRLVDEGVLELARRDAERVFVGKAVGASAWPQERICALIAAEARRGRRVVRLKSGDPSIFGRATEELEAARRAGIPVEVVPGVTAASAAAAALGRSLTERGATDSVVLATATCRPGDPDPDWAHHARAGTALALYMGVRRAGEIAARLAAQGIPAAQPVEVACDVSHPHERLIRCTLGTLAATLRARGVTGSAVILLRFDKRAALAPMIAAE